MAKMTVLKEIGKNGKKFGYKIMKTFTNFDDAFDFVQAQNENLKYVILSSTRLNQLLSGV